MPFPALSHLALSAIDDGARFSLHPFLPATVSNRLRDSCQRVGILTPPLVLENTDGTYELLDGRQRLTVAREVLRLERLPCRILPAASPERFVLAALFESQNSAAPLSPMESARFLRLVRCSRCDDEEKRLLLDLLFPGRESRNQPQRSERLLELEENLQQLVHSRFLTETMALELLKLAQEDRQRLVEVFRVFEMGAGKQKRLFTLARDIARRQAVSIAAILGQPPLLDILEHKEMNRPQKAHSLLSALQELASPSLAADEEAFRRLVASLDPPPGCSIHHSPSFETDAVGLTITFGSVDRLLEAWPAVRGILLSQGRGQR